MRNKMIRAVGLLALVGVIIPANIFVYATTDTQFVESVQSTMSVTAAEELSETAEISKNNDIQNTVVAEVAEVLGMEIEEEETYSLIFGEELAKYDIIYKSPDTEDVLGDKFGELNPITTADLSSTTMVDIPDVATMEEQEKEKAERAELAKREEEMAKNIEIGETQSTKKPAPAKAKIIYDVPANCLLGIENPDPNYTGAIVTLSAEDRDILERLVMGEAGGEGMEGAALVAQAIRDTMVYKGFTSVNDVRIACGYTGSLKRSPNQNVKDAVAYIFDQGGNAVQHRIFYFYAPKLVKSKFHESQRFVIEYGGHRFFSNHY